MEEVKQDDAFVRVLLERVLHLLLITLQERASAMPTLHHDLGLPASHKVPVSGPLQPCPFLTDSTPLVLPTKQDSS